MEKERRITAPKGCEIEKAEIVDGVAVITFKEKERRLPKTWDEFVDLFPIKDGECLIENSGMVERYSVEHWGKYRKWENLLPDRATAEAVLALCQLIQLRNAYNGEWLPDWDDEEQEKYVITFVCCDEIMITDSYNGAYSPLYFKNKGISEEFLRNFRQLIEKLKPLYGIKEGGEE